MQSPSPVADHTCIVDSDDCSLQRKYRAGSAAWLFAEKQAARSRVGEVEEVAVLNTSDLPEVEAH